MRFYRMLISAVLLLFLLSILPTSIIPQQIAAACTYRDDSVLIISEFVQLLENSLLPNDSLWRQFSFGLSTHPSARLLFYLLTFILLFHARLCEWIREYFHITHISVFDFFINHPRLAPPNYLLY